MVAKIEALRRRSAKRFFLGKGEGESDRACRTMKSSISGPANFTRATSPGSETFARGDFVLPDSTSPA
jgi:hypothetical protein